MGGNDSYRRPNYPHLLDSVFSATTELGALLAASRMQAAATRRPGAMQGLLRLPAGSLSRSATTVCVSLGPCASTVTSGCRSPRWWSQPIAAVHRLLRPGSVRPSPMHDATPVHSGALLPLSGFFTRYTIKR